jgi:DNA-binding protein H-NS
MSKYSELLKQLEELDRRIEEAKRSEYGPALEEVRATIEAFGFSPTEVFEQSHGRAVKKTKTGKRGTLAKRPKSAKSEGTDPRQAQIEFA